MTAAADSLERFRTAQDGGQFEAALAEIQSGRKRGHWIWFVFPQISGLGESGMSTHYAIRDAAEAADYLRDPVLGSRLLQITKAVLGHLEQGVAPSRLMGSEIDALKLVSSMTLFEHTARSVGNGSLAEAAAKVLNFADQEGYPACGFTQRLLDS